MKQQLFMDLLNVAWDDYRAQEDIDGMIIVTIKRGANGDALTQLGCNIPPDVVKHVFGQFVQAWLEDRRPFAHVPHRTLRKAV